LASSGEGGDVDIESVVKGMEIKLQKELAADECSVTLLPRETDPKKGQHHTITPGGSEAKVYITVISEVFDKMPAVQRQRKVYGLISNEMEGPIHAVSSMITKTPAEWAAALSKEHKDCPGAE